MLSDGNLCELTQIGDDLIGQDPHVGTGGSRSPTYVWVGSEKVSECG